MKPQRMISALFIVAGLYDGLLGAAFIVAGARLFEWFEVPPPNHMGYVMFPAALLIIFGLMFFAIAANPQRNRNLIPYGMLLKVSYCSVVGYYWLTAGVPNMWKPWCVADLAFLIAFAWAWVALRRPRDKAAA